MGTRMHRSLGYLTLFAAALFAAALTLATLGGVTSLGRMHVKGTGLSLDTVAFASGLLTGVAAVWLSMVPWRAFPRYLLQWMVTWRRNFVLASLACVCAGVLLFY